MLLRRQVNEERDEHIDMTPMVDGVFQLMTGQNTDDTITGGDDAFGSQASRTGDACRAGRFTTETAGPDLRFGIQDFLIGDLPNDAIAGVQSSETLFQVDRTIDFNRAGNRRGFAMFVIHVGEEGVDRSIVGHSPVPADASLFIQLIQRVRPGRIDHRQTGNAIDQTQVLQFDECFTECRRISQVSAGDHDPVGNLPIKAFQHAIHDRLLTFEPERVDAVTQVDPPLPGDFADSFESIIEITQDLQRLRVVVEGLRKFAEGDLTAADKDDDTEQLGRAGIDRQGGTGVAGGGTRSHFGSDHAGMCRRGSHPVVFKTAGRIQAFVLQEQPTRIHSDVFAHRGILLQDGLTFADRDVVFVRGKRQQLAKPPDSAVIERIASICPFGFEFPQGFRNGQFVPLVI